MTTPTADSQSRPLLQHVAVIGAAGGLGQGILNVCRSAGKSFTAIVRSRPERITAVPVGSRVVVVESLNDRPALMEAFAGADAVLTALGATATTHEHSSDRYSRSSKVGEKAPEFKLKDQAGEERMLSTMMKDGPVALVFYLSASW